MVVSIFLKVFKLLPKDDFWFLLLIKNLVMTIKREIMTIKMTPNIIIRSDLGRWVKRCLIISLLATS